MLCSYCCSCPHLVSHHHFANTAADGKYCLTGASDRTVRLWNPTRIDPAYGYHLSSSKRDNMSQSSSLPSALPMQTYSDGHIHPIYCLATNRSSTTLLSASDKTLLATDLLTAQNKQKWWGHVGRIEYVTCLGGTNTDDTDNNNSSGGGGNVVGEEIYASASYDSSVRLWDARSRSKDPLMTLEDATDAVTCVTQSPSSYHSQIITSSVDGKIRTYDLRYSRMMAEDIVHPITSFAVTNDGMSSMMAVSCLDGIIRVLDRSIITANAAATTGIRKRVYQKFHSYHTCNKYKVECAFTSSDEYLVTGSECGAVVIYPVEVNSNNQHYSTRPERNNTKPSPKGRVLRRHQGPTCSVAACPQSARPWLIVSASYDGTAVVWASEAQHDCCLVE
jgi:mitogen-activated protein kinase organizer 1